MYRVQKAKLSFAIKVKNLFFIIIFFTQTVGDICLCNDYKVLLSTMGCAQKRLKIIKGLE